MSRGGDLLLRALRDPACVRPLNDGDWDLLLRAAKASGLLGRLGHAWLNLDGGTWLPGAVRHALEAPRLLSSQQQRAVRWELPLLEESLAPLAGPILLLKGAAYAAADLPAAAGRVFSDIDLMVPRDQIEQAEELLRLSGWLTGHHSEYDERYYRQWMHELPPMLHMQRGTSLDVHHRLLPLTASLRTDPEPVFEASERLDAHSRLRIPSELDRILHSACHLFHEGEWHNGLRDLSDLDLLLRAALRQRGDGLWSDLAARAAQLNMGRPLYYALRYCQRILGTPIPEAALTLCPAQPPGWQKVGMDQVFVPALTEGFAQQKQLKTQLACGFLYLRSHVLRMPLRLLVPHLLTKAWMAVIAKPEPSPEEAA